MSSVVCETSVTVPAELVRQCEDLALDMGGSAIKIVYRSKENLKEVNSSDVKVGHLQLVSFSGTQIDDALDFLAKINPPPSEDKKRVFATGLGCTANERKISDRLNIELKTVVEFECFVRAFHYLSANLSSQQLLTPYELDSGLEEFPGGDLQQMILKQLLISGNSSPPEVDFDTQLAQDLNLGRTASSDSDLSAAASDPEFYPCLLVSCGSGISFMQVNADGSYKLLDAGSWGGRAVYGLGSILTGCQSFHELLELASKGNHQNVHTLTGDLFKTLNEHTGNMYSELSKYETIVYNFGKCVEAKRDQFSSEDLASALLSHCVMDMVHITSLVASMAGIRRVFFCGSFVNSQLVRRLFTGMFVRRNLSSCIFQHDRIKFDFLQTCAHLGTIGALILQLEEQKDKHINKENKNINEQTNK